MTAEQRSTRWDPPIPVSESRSLGAHREQRTDCGVRSAGCGKVQWRHAARKRFIGGACVLGDCQWVCTCAQKSANQFGLVSRRRQMQRGDAQR